MKSPLIIGNLKLHGKIELIKNLIQGLNNISIFNSNVSIAPPEIFLQYACKISKNKNVSICAQNVDVHLDGPFTGETSAKMLKEIGVKYVIIGHSERRKYHFEDDLTISKKIEVTKSQNLIPILCIGETKRKDFSESIKFCKKQIDNLIILGTDIKNVVFAYEPIWAIGTGVSADPKEIQNISKFIKSYVSEKSKCSYENIIVQYGGSINEKNVINFLKQKDIDGLLIGSSSIQYKLFSKIILCIERFLESDI
ncbi:hypothetical protein AOQ88_01360 [Candidatus Riesia sp. GBBU]|nr:hypothetical protein AOQ88_01360 [Candidatus Riesia sp. GBBU]